MALTLAYTLEDGTGPVDDAPGRVEVGLCRLSHRTGRVVMTKARATVLSPLGAVPAERYVYLDLIEGVWWLTTAAVDPSPRPADEA